MEMIHQEKIEVARKYEDKIPRNGSVFHVKGEIPSVKINNAMSAYAPSLERKTVIALYDTTVTENGKEGMIITDNEIYYKAYLKSAGRIMFSDIEEVGLGDYVLKNGDRESVSLSSGHSGYDISAMRDMIKELIAIDKKYAIKPKKRELTKLDLMEKYGKKIIGSTYDFYLRGTEPERVLKNAISKYAGEVSRSDVLGLFDVTITSNGKKGMIFTKEAMYQNIESNFRRVINYSDIISVNKKGSYSVEITYMSVDYSIYTNTSDWDYLSLDEFVEFLDKVRYAPN